MKTRLAGEEGWASSNHVDVQLDRSAILSVFYPFFTPFYLFFMWTISNVYPFFYLEIFCFFFVFFLFLRNFVCAGASLSVLDSQHLGSSTALLSFVWTDVCTGSSLSVLDFQHLCSLVLLLSFASVDVVYFALAHHCCCGVLFAQVLHG